MDLKGIKELPYTNGQTNRFVVIGDKKVVSGGTCRVDGFA